MTFPLNYPIMVHFLLLVLASFAAAVSESGPSAVAVNGPPTGYSQKEWDSYFKDSNINGSFPIEGYNISGSFISSETIKGWTAIIQVANITKGSDDPYIGTNIAIQKPDDLELPTGATGDENSDDDSSVTPKGWDICMLFIEPQSVSDKAIDKGQDDDGSCSSFLTKECIQDLENLANKHVYTGSKCPNAPRIPSSCRNSDQLGKGDMVTVTTTSRVGLNRLDGETILAYTPAHNNKTIDESYRDAVRGIWPMMINWGRESISDAEISLLTCLHPRDGGAEKIEDSDSGATTGFQSRAVLAISVLATLYMLCL